MKTRLTIIFIIAVAVGMLTLTSSEIFPDVHAQIMYSSSYSQSTVPLSEIYSIMTKQVKYNIPYDMTGGTVDEMIPYCESGSLVIRIASNESGKLAIDIPRNLLDIKYENDEDKDFIILVDGEEKSFEETRHAYSREYSISLTSDSNEIEIIGTLFPSDDTKKVHCEIAHNPPYAYILPPSKQMKNNVFPEDVICEPNLAKAYKFSNGNPVCVKPSSIEELSERKWTTGPDNSDGHILKYSPVLFKGTAIIADDDKLSLEELQKLQQRKIEIDRLLEDRSIVSEKTQDELSDERNMIKYYSQQAFDNEVSFETIAVLWEKRMQLREFLSAHDREERFPIACTSGISIGYHAYSLDERYVGNPTVLIISVPEEHFTKSNLQNADDIIREQTGEEIDIMYQKSDCYAIPAG